MNEYVDLFIRSLVTGIGSGVGTFLVMKVMLKHWQEEKK
jgi:hypothetical protein